MAQVVLGHLTIRTMVDIYGHMDIHHLRMMMESDDAIETDCVDDTFEYAGVLADHSDQIMTDFASTI